MSYKFSANSSFSSASSVLFAVLGVVAATALLPAASAQAQEFSAENFLLGDWGGAREDLHDDGVDLKLGHFSQAAHNVSGGQTEETAYAGQFFFGGYADLEKLLRWKGATFRVEITKRHGTLINNEAGMPFLLQSQQIFGRGNVTRLTQLSLTQSLYNDHVSLKGGRIYPSSDFFAQSCAFQHLTFCSGGSSNYISSNWYGDPLSAPGARIVVTPDKKVYFKFGVYDANPQNALPNQGLKLGTSGGTKGTLLVGEVEYKADWGNGLDGDYRFGFARSSINKDKITNTAGFPRGITSDPTIVEGTDKAFFVNLEQQVTRNSAGGGLRLFASLINSDDDVSSVGEVIAIGGFVRAPFASRPKDRIGLAFGRNTLSSQLTRAQRRYGTAFPAIPIAVQSHEYPIEMNYNVAVFNGLEVMPSIQYVIDPNGVKKAKDAVVLGLQFNVSL